LEKLEVEKLVELVEEILVEIELKLDEKVCKELDKLKVLSTKMSSRLILLVAVEFAKIGENKPKNKPINRKNIRLTKPKSPVKSQKLPVFSFLKKCLIIILGNKSMQKLPF